MRKPNIGLLKREKRLLMTREEGKRETFTRHVDLSMMMRIKRAKDKVREKERNRETETKKTHFLVEDTWAWSVEFGFFSHIYVCMLLYT